MPTFEYANVLLEFSDITSGLKDISEAKYFLKYANNSGQFSGEAPKFVFYSAHAETVAPIQRLFRYPFDMDLINPEPAAMVLVNYWRCDLCHESDPNKYQVSASYVP